MTINLQIKLSRGIVWWRRCPLLWMMGLLAQFDWETDLTFIKLCYAADRVECQHSPSLPWFIFRSRLSTLLCPVHISYKNGAEHLHIGAGCFQRTRNRWNRPSIYPFTVLLNSHSFIHITLNCRYSMWSPRTKPKAWTWHLTYILRTSTLPGTRPAADKADYQNALNIPMFMHRILDSV